MLDTTENRTAQLVSMAEAADADEEVLAEGMQAEHEHEHEHEHDHHDDESDSHEEPPELDEHVWLSLRRAALACTAMKEALCKADPAHEDIYNQNCTDYLQKLQELDSDFTEMTSQDGTGYHCGGRPLSVPVSGGGLRTDLLRRISGLLRRNGSKL